MINSIKIYYPRGKLYVKLMIPTVYLLEFIHIDEIKDKYFFVEIFTEKRRIFSEIVYNAFDISIYNEDDLIARIYEIHKENKFIGNDCKENIKETNFKCKTSGNNGLMTAKNNMSTQICKKNLNEKVKENQHCKISGIYGDTVAISDNPQCKKFETTDRDILSNEYNLLQLNENHFYMNKEIAILFMDRLHSYINGPIHCKNKFCNILIFFKLNIFNTRFIHDIMSFSTHNTCKCCCFNNTSGKCIHNLSKNAIVNEIRLYTTSGTIFSPTEYRQFILLLKDTESYSRRIYLIITFLPKLTIRDVKSIVSLVNLNSIDYNQRIYFLFIISKYFISNGMYRQSYYFNTRCYLSIRDGMNHKFRNYLKSCTFIIGKKWEDQFRKFNLVVDHVEGKETGYIKPSIRNILCFNKNKDNVGVISSDAWPYKKSAVSSNIQEDDFIKEFAICSNDRIERCTKDGIFCPSSYRPDLIYYTSSVKLKVRTKEKILIVSINGWESINSGIDCNLGSYTDNHFNNEITPNNGMDDYENIYKQHDLNSEIRKNVQKEPINSLENLGSDQHSQKSIKRKINVYKTIENMDFNIFLDQEMKHFRVENVTFIYKDVIYTKNVKKYTLIQVKENCKLVLLKKCDFAIKGDEIFFQFAGVKHIKILENSESLYFEPTDDGFKLYSKIDKIVKGEVFFSYLINKEFNKIIKCSYETF